ncbi:rhamnan synthesis F family protein [Microbacterium sp. ACRRU]|uniref:rhamnan synthesis F family protein n=1 Tax=Microbacterium sp. ACRRU TaxID=2918204 RepID=UPI001EF6B6F2|nr:rhamnan synthesis F family protein [Microbacterium sp. ACRRU]MCG7418134.1 rhamnan synthesis F family protein [Microbacterium sp. ACRRU]
MKTAELIGDWTRPANVFPADGRRLLIYVVFDRRGEVGDFVVYALERLREFCDEIVVVSNGPLAETGRARLVDVADQVLERPNEGYDIWGYKHGLDAVGDRVSEFDELLLVNDTWFGPIRPFRPIFERMDGHALHFWGMTDHLRVEPHPFTQEQEYLPYHLQSYWVAVRREMFESPEWAEYWRDLPHMSTYSDAVTKHEGIFTQHFTTQGFSGEVAFPTLTDKIENHAVLYAEQLIEAGCPTLKRRPFFQWPPFLDRVAVVGKWTLEAVERSGYPVEMIFEDLARNVEPRVLNADAALMRVLSPTDDAYDPSAPLRTAVFAHVFYVEMTDEILDRAGYLPGDIDVFITTPDGDRAGQIERIIAERAHRGRTEVRVVASNNGRDQAAFLIGCRDVLLSDDYDLIVKIHSKKTPQGGANVGRHFRRHQFGNLLAGPHEAANVVALFQKRPGLGLAFPPTVHLGHPTMGHGWWANRPGVEKLCAELGIRVPLDEVSPLAPFGSMFFARPEALRLLVEREWTYEEFGGAEAYVDGGLAHVLERMPVYAAAELGYHSITIATPDYLSKSYTAWDYNLDQMSATMPEDTQHQIDFLRRAGYIGWGRFRDFVDVWVRLHRPEIADSVERLFARTERARGAAWRVRRRLRRR